MAFYQIPTPNDVAWFRFKITLSNVSFTIRMRYNSRMQRWMLDLADPSNNDILNGMPLLLNRDFLQQYVIPNLPAGRIFALSAVNNDIQPTRYSFGSQDVLVYYDPDT